jgi:hypothetical protein
MMKSITGIPVLLCMLICIAVQAQDEMKWGKLSKEELSKRTFTRDKEADAVILGDIGEVMFDLRSSDKLVKFERHCRMKFLTEAGVEQYGKVEISYFTGEDNAELSGLKAQVYLQDGSEVGVKKDQISTATDERGWTTTTIDLPGLEVGAVAEFKYVIKSADFSRPVDWYFQRDIPIVSSKLSVQFPEWFEFISIRQGRLRIEESFELGTDFITGVDFSGYARLNFPARTMQNALRVKLRTDHYAVRNVPALRPERFITTMDDYYARVRYELQTIRLPESDPEYVMGTWVDAEQRLLEHETFGKQFLSEKNGEAVLSFANITDATAMSERDRAIKLYEVLCQRLKWNNEFAFKASGSVPVILRNRGGTSGDLNIALLAGLLALGIDAVPVLTSTRAHGQVVEKYSLLDQFDHALVLARLNGVPTLLDVAGPHQPAGYPALDAMNYRGWAMRNENSKWIDLKTEPSRSTRYFQFKCDQNGNLSGSLNAQFTGYQALDHRRAYWDQPELYAQSDLHDYVLPLHLTSITPDSMDHNNQPWSFTVDVQCEARTVNNEFIYITLPFSKALTQSPFPSESRDFPVEFSYPVFDKWIIDIVIPDGYEVDSLPVSQKVGTENDRIVYTYRAGVSQGKVQLVLDIGVQHLQYDPHEYEVLKTLYDRLATATRERVVLKKL